MGYHVIMEEVEQAERTIQKKAAEWTAQMDQVWAAVNGYMECMGTKAEGEVAESVTSYMAEVHLYLMERFYLLFYN